MYQLVRKELLTFHCSRRIFARAKYNMIPNGVCTGVHCARRIPSSAVGMYSHSAEVASEPGLEIGAARYVERLAGRAQHLVHERRRLLTALHRRDRLPL